MMASTYPTSLDTFTNPTATSLLTSPSHAQQHSDINDAVEALETKVAIGNTVLGVYQSYTPTWTNLTVGNASILARYCRVNNFVNAAGYIIFGTTTSVSGAISLTLPVNAQSPAAIVNFFVLGNVTFRDASANSVYYGYAQSALSATTMTLKTINTAGTYGLQTDLSATVPFTWADQDRILWNIIYEAA